MRVMTASMPIAGARVSVSVPMHAVTMKRVAVLTCMSVMAFASCVGGRGCHDQAGDQGPWQDACFHLDNSVFSCQCGLRLRGRR